MTTITKTTLAIAAIACLIGCGDAGQIMEPNTYRKCSEYSLQRQRIASFDMHTLEVTVDTTWVMTYQGKAVTLTPAQAKRLDTDPTGVCRDVM